jgi:hypothetical protein
LYLYVPKAHTCANVLELPRGEVTQPLPPSEDLFAIYDGAFSKNEHFGIP